MKNLKNLIQSAKALKGSNGAELQEILWKVICYSPKMPVRLQQQELLNEAEIVELEITDEHFAKGTLLFKAFKWGSGTKRVLLTHGWGSKAADFSELIIALKQLPDTEIIAFDAPGNGSSEGELSNLLLYVQSVKALMEKFGAADVLIGHSLGAMANVIAIKEHQTKPSLLISLAPLVRLKENFEATMHLAEVSEEAQATFFKDFNKTFNVPADYFNLVDLYPFNEQLKHWIAYDPEDRIHPYEFMREFLDSRPFISSNSYAGVGHDKILKDRRVIEAIVSCCR